MNLGLDDQGERPRGRSANIGPHGFDVAAADRHRPAWDPAVGLRRLAGERVFVLAGVASRPVAPRNADDHVAVALAGAARRKAQLVGYGNRRRHNLG